MEIEQLYSIFIKYRIICTDTRKIAPNSLFFALKGQNFNGNQFAQQALKLGARFAVVDEEEFATENCILVDNVLTALQELATYHRTQLSIPIIGITGSNGKTTTKELCHAVLSQKFNCYATKGNLNNHIGVPLSVLELTSLHEIAIIEMGANHVGEIAELCLIAQPTIGLITNIGKAHLEGFGGIEGVKKAKSELYQYLSSHDNPIFVNGDNPILMELSDNVVSYKYGVSKDYDIVGTYDNKSSQLTLSWKKKNFISYHPPIQTNLIGDYNFENALAAITVGNHFGVSVEEIKNGLESYTPSNNRSQLIMKGTNKIIMDAYNANPVSMKAAIENISKQADENKLLILGGMRELGEFSISEHQILIDLVKKLNLNCLLVGNEFKNLDQNPFQLFTNTSDVQIYLKEKKTQNSLILIKGSRGIKLESLIDVF